MNIRNILIVLVITIGLSIGITSCGQNGSGNSSGGALTGSAAEKVLLLLVSMMNFMHLFLVALVVS